MSRTMRPSTWLRNARRTTSPMASKSASVSGRTTTSFAGTVFIRVSRVVEERVVETDERSCPLGVGAFDRICAEMVVDVGRADEMGAVPPSVLPLHEGSTWYVARRKPAL